VKRKIRAVALGLNLETSKAQFRFLKLKKLLCNLVNLIFKINTTIASLIYCSLYTVKVMLVVFYAVIREKEKGVPCMGCFSCAFAFGSYFRVWSSYKKPKNLKTFLNLGFPALGKTLSYS